MQTMLCWEKDEPSDWEEGDELPFGADFPKLSVGDKLALDFGDGKGTYENIIVSEVEITYYYSTGIVEQFVLIKDGGEEGED